MKFFAENIISDFVDLYVETKFDGDDNPFWGIDDVRICNAKGNYSVINPYCTIILYLF